MANRISPEIRAYMKRLSKKAAAARKEKITPAQRREIATNAAKARWKTAKAA